jgi:hypothetical protein
MGNAAAIVSGAGREWTPTSSFRPVHFDLDNEIRRRARRREAAL